MKKIRIKTSRDVTGTEHVPEFTRFRTVFTDGLPKVLSLKILPHGATV